MVRASLDLPPRTGMLAANRVEPNRNESDAAAQPEADPQATGGGLAFALVAAAVLVGFVLRAWQLGDQLVAGDEVHGLRAAVRESPGYLLTHNTVPDYEESDYSIPFALYHHFAMRTVGLGEWTFRLPSFLAGILLMPLVAAFARRWMSGRAGPSVAPVVTWLVALSPPFFLFSRFARPYMPLVYLVLLAAYAALRWRPGEDRRWGGTLVLASAGALFLNLTAAPALACIWVWSGLQARRSGPAALKRWTLLVVCGAVLSAALIAPGLGALMAFAETKSGSARFSPIKSWRALHILWGTNSSWLVVVASSLAAFGAVASWRAGHRPARLFVAIFAADLAVLFLFAPGGAQHPSVMARYTLTAWPGVLLFTGVGIATLGSLLGRHMGTGLGAVFVALLLGTGPLPGILSHRNAFTNHRFHYGLPEWEFDPAQAPAIYAELAGQNLEGTIVEVPYTLEWGLTVYGLYQEIHGKPVQAFSTFATYFRQSGVEFSSIVPWKGDKPIYRGIDVIVVHKDIVAEAYLVTGRNGGEWPENMGKKRWGYMNDAKIALQVCQASPQFETTYEDDRVVVLRRKK